jgi:integrase/recombinase XerD
MKKSLRKTFDFYVEYMRVRQLSENTVAHRIYCGGKFLDWCDDRDMVAPRQLDRKVVDAYQRFVHRQRRKDGKPYSVRSQILRLDAVRGFCRFLLREEFIQRDPTVNMELPKTPKSLPKAILSLEEMQKVLALPNVNRPTGLRDRAILEVFWATGIRRKELLELELYSIDTHQKTIMVHGKGNKDRVLPIGERAIEWVVRYLNDARPQLTDDPDQTALFVSERGAPLCRESLSQYVATYIRRAELGKLGSCHLIRHSVGTMLMRNGLNLRHVQEMLGHAKLETTEIYTHVVISELKAAYRKAHPSSDEGPKNGPATS